MSDQSAANRERAWSVHLLINNDVHENDERAQRSSDYPERIAKPERTIRKR